MHRSLRIVFMGTPGFAVPSLDILVRNGYDIAGVVTSPDKHAGRGQHIQQSEVKKFAETNSLRILQPEKLKDPHFISQLEALGANLFIVVAFRMLPEVVWKMPEYGTFNLHASLLPQYRGAAPINWAVINGEKETGVTTFFLKHEIDTGNIIYQEKTEIEDTDTAGTLHDKLSAIGAELVLKTVKAIESNSVAQHAQPEATKILHAPKIFKEDCLIDWNMPAEKIHDLIRGLSPYPAAFTKVDSKVMKIYASKILHGTEEPAHCYKKDNLITDNKTFLRFLCSDGWLDVQELQLEGKKRMKTEEFLRGHRFN